jgi:hypothetical protein
MNLYRKNSAMCLLIGVVIADLGMLLIGLGAWDALNGEMAILNYVGGSILFLSGLILVWIDARLTVTRTKPVKPKRSDLGKFRLNGYVFEAYEQGVDNSVRKFRLLSSPSVDPAREAAFIRYMVHEGLTEVMWPKMRRQIEEKAKWAFLP